MGRFCTILVERFVCLLAPLLLLVAQFSVALPAFVVVLYKALLRVFLHQKGRVLQKGGRGQGRVGHFDLNLQV